MKIIDLETAHIYSKEERINLFTPVFTHKSVLKGKDIGYRSDLYQLGMLLFHLISPTTVLKNLKETFINDLLNSLSVDYGLPIDFIEIIDNLTNYKEKYNNIDEVIFDIQNINLNKSKKNNFNKNNTKSIDLNETIIKTCEQIISSSNTNKKNATFFKNYPIRVNDFNIVHGDLGVLYALNYIGYNYSNDFLNPLKEKIEETEYIVPGLYTGLAGMAWAMYELGEKSYSLTLMNQANKNIVNQQDFTIYSGFAGIGLANLYFWFQTKNKNFLKQAEEIGSHIINNSIQTENGIYWKNNSEISNNGYLQGSSGIALFLLYLYKITKKNKYLIYCKKALTYDINQTVHFKNVISLRRRNNVEVISPYFSNGTAGLITTLCRLIKYDNNIEDYYIDSFYNLIKDCERKYTAYPGLFSGLAGIGNTLLDCYQVFNDHKYLNMAYKITESILLYKIKIGKGYGFPSNTLLRVSNDFSTGSSGIVLFLDRLQNNKANFNFTLDEYINNLKQTDKNKKQEKSNPISTVLGPF